MTTSAPSPRNSQGSAFLKVLIPVFVIVLLASGALYLVKSHLAPKQTASESQPTSGPVQIGSVIPDFELQGIGGKSTKLSEINAKVMLVNFWATWCEACMEEMPSIVKLRNAYKSKGLEVVGINLDENPDAVVPRAEKQLKIDFPVFNGTENKITDYFDVHAIPLTVFLGPGRKILYIENGERNWNDEDVRHQIEQWLGVS